MGDAPSRELLVLVQHYPPDLRIFKFTRHLLSFGWRSVLLAGRRTRGATYFGDDEVATDLDVRLTYAPRPLSEVLRPLLVRGTSGSAMNDGSAPPSTGWRRLASNVGRRTLLWVGTPDEWVSWLPWAVGHGMSLARRRPIRAILASGPPFSILLAGAALRRLTGLPLIADFRDAWVLDETDPFGTIGGMVRAPYGRARIRVLSMFERYVLRSAELVLFTSDYTRAEYCRKYPFVLQRSVVLYNGVDEDDFYGQAASPATFSFSHVGSIHEYQYSQVAIFLTAFARALQIYPELRDTVTYFVGPRSPRTDALLRELSRRLGLEDRLVLDNVVRHRKAMDVVRSAGALLLFSGENRFVRLSKISPYLASGRPILAFAAGDSETARHVREAGHLVFDGTAVDDLVPVLRTLRDAPLRKSPGAFPFPQPHVLHWRTSAMRLAQELDRFTGEPAPVTGRERWA
jgi:glycosyltransferase involved in cell wall biosynthesis